MADALVESAQDIDPGLAELPVRQRYWLLAVAWA